MCLFFISTSKDTLYCTVPIIMRMYVSEPSEELSCEIGNAIEQCKTETTQQGSHERQQWRRGRDSNPG